MAKAEAAEQKAHTARDETARVAAWREAAHQWDRAASRETDDKRRQAYTDKAEAARSSADGAPADDADDDESDIATDPNTKPTLLN